MKIIHQMKRIYSVPKDIIIAYNSSATSAPTGWNFWNTANGKHIVGAGSGYSGGQNGLEAIGTATTPSDGAHTAQIANPPMHTGSFTDNYYGNASTGNHTHDLTLTYEPKYRQLRLIKSNTVLKQFPQYGVLFGKTDLSARLTPILVGDNKLFRAGATLADGGVSPGGGALPAPSVSLSGLHGHGTKIATGVEDLTGGYCFSTPDAGLHNDHICTAVLQTESIKKAVLTAWSNASTAFDLIDGVIAMYESATPPKGWALCNGDYGTYDLRDYFIYIGTTPTAGAGTNTITVDITIGESLWIHTHQTGGQLDPEVGIDNTNHRYSDPSDTAHHHPTAAEGPPGVMTGTSLSYVPAYYALYFIQKV